mgnify:CR=1 FL=1
MARPNITLSAKLVCRGQARLFGVAAGAGRLISPLGVAYEAYERRISGVQRWDPVVLDTLDEPTLDKLGILGDAAHALDGVDDFRRRYPVGTTLADMEKPQ